VLAEVAEDAGGGEGYADDVEVVLEDVLEGGGVCPVGSGAVTPGTAAFLRNVVILSLYASFSFAISPL